jgi:hypothetical protein
MGWNHDTDIFQDTTLDINYFQEQLDFINSLTQHERNILASYTYKGDRLINGLLKNTLSSGKELCDYLKTAGPEFPFAELPTESNCLSLVKKYEQEFSSIFKRVPVLKTKLRVFRAFIPVVGWKPGGFYSKLTSPSQEYMSTTYASQDDAEIRGFMNSQDDNGCCLMEMILEPGIRALWIEPISKIPNEREIVVEKNVAVYNACIKYKLYKYIDYGPNNYNYNEEFLNMTVYEFNIKPYKDWMSKLGDILYEVGLKCSTRRKGGNRSKFLSKKRLHKNRKQGLFRKNPTKKLITS